MRSHAERGNEEVIRMMRRILLAFRVFFLTLFNGSIAEQVAKIFAGEVKAETPVLQTV